MADRTFAFGPFRLVPERHLLFEGEKPLRLGSRALDILIVLAARPGDLVTKEELVAEVWPDTIVEEGNLRVHMAALRKALGEGQAGNRFVATVPGRGYRFIAPISLLEAAPLEAAPAQPPAAPASDHNLPTSLTRLVGRSETVATLIAQVKERRFITIAGPGGIGKTAVALAAADELSAWFRDNVRFADFSSVSDPQLVASVVASALGVAIRSADPVAGLIAFLRDKHMLLVLDNCEHVIEEAAALAEEILSRAPGVHVLTTSREPLRASGERVHRLLPLDVPTPSPDLSAAEALAFPAVQLFVERAIANSDQFKLNDADAPIVANICRRLDGMPLAIELAAGCVDAFGVTGVASRLDDRFHFLTRGRRTALPRHQTLSATLDWSYELLPESERVILRRLAIFAGWFTMEAASAVTRGGQVVASDIVDQVANLGAKSLVTADVGGATVYYRLLESTRAYALEKLKQTNESGLFARRHVEYFKDLFEHAEIEWETRATAEWLAAYGRQIDDVRAALDWAFSPDGDTAIGVALTIAAVPLWRLLSLMEECRIRAQRAFDNLEPHARANSREAMRLLAALAAALRYDKAPDSEMEETWTDVLSIAERLDDADYQLRALSGLRNARLSDGNLRASLSLARRFKEVAARASDPLDILVGDRMIGYALHFLGEPAEARQHIENMLSHYPATAHRSHIVRFGYDQRVLAHHTLAEILWLQGFPEQAMQTTESNVGYAQSINHELSLCNSLGQGACPIALFVGDLTAAARYVAMLLDHSARHVLPLWHATGRCFDGVLRIKRGDITAGLNTLRIGLDEVLETRFVTRYIAFLAELAEACAQAGELAKAQTAIGDAFERCHRNEEFWYIPELQRIRGEILLREGAPDAVLAAESCFLKSLNWAQRQGALAWELRAAMSLARLRRSQGRLDDARDQLASVYGKFTEGFETADLETAQELFNELG